MTINYTNTTPAQRHFAGRLDDLLEHLKQIHRRGELEFEISAYPGEYIDLTLREVNDKTPPVQEWLEHTVWSVIRMDDDTWRVWPPNQTVEQAGYSPMGQLVPRPGVDFDTPDTGTGARVMETPEGWTETAVLVALELSDVNLETGLTLLAMERVFTVLQIDHEDPERLARWVSEVDCGYRGARPTLREVIDNADDWARREQAADGCHYHSKDDYAREWLEDNHSLEDWLIDCLDLDAVADALLDGMDWIETSDGVVVYS